MNNSLQLPNTGDPRIDRNRRLDALRIALHNAQMNRIGADILFAKALHQATGYTYRRCNEITRKVFGYE